MLVLFDEKAQKSSRDPSPGISPPPRTFGPERLDRLGQSPGADPARPRRASLSVVAAGRRQNHHRCPQCPTIPVVEKSDCQSTTNLGLTRSNAKANIEVHVETPSSTASS